VACLTGEQGPLAKLVEKCSGLFESQWLREDTSSAENDIGIRRGDSIDKGNWNKNPWTKRKPVQGVEREENCVSLGKALPIQGQF